jgi:hypothetical protein
MLIYTGRTNHIHVLTHNPNATTVHKNKTLSGLVASHVGQIFFDQELQAQVEANEPYSSNTQALTMNANDMIFASEAEYSDPIMEYVLLGGHVTEGTLGWITIGIDPRETRNASARATYHKGGGVQDESSDVMGPARPSGIPPSAIGTPVPASTAGTP